jgi:NTP pyrophosphatase (non-canonical NTP hydrolase)
MKHTTLSQLAQMMIDFRAQRDWEQFHTPKDMAIGLCLEAAELLELMQWKHGQELADHLEKHRAELSDELADVLGWILLLAHDFKIDLAEAYRQKMAKNEAKYPVHKVKGSSRKYTEYEP